MDRNAQLRRLLDGMPFPASMAALDGSIVYANAHMAALFGPQLAASPDLGVWFERAYPDPTCRADAEARWHQRVDRQRGVIDPDTFKIRCDDGRERWVEIFGTVYDDLIVVLFRDQTELREGRRRAEAEAQFNQAVVESAAEGICVCHATETEPFIHFTVWNSRMEEITGYTRDEINARGWYQTLYPDPEVRQSAMERMNRMREGNNLRAESWTITDRSGRARTLAISTSIVSTEQGPPSVLAMMQDITQRTEEAARRQELENKIQQAQRLESLGVLAGGIAHDFNNLLTIMMGHAELALVDLDEPDATDPVATSVREIITAGEQARRLTDQMLAYVGKRAPVTDDCDLNALVQRAPELAEAPGGVDVVLDLDPELPVCRGDRGQLAQVVASLLHNALDAVEAVEASRVELRTRIIEVAGGRHPEWDAPGILGRRLPAGRYVSLRVLDNGDGIDQATLDRIFEPFFSTKFQGRGLSLAAVLGILRGHEGEIFVRGNPGRGAEFEVLLPTPETSAAHARVEQAQAPGPERRAPRVALVVDDEGMVRQIAARMLQKEGFETLEAEDGQAALDALDRVDGLVDLILLDLTMPRLDGLSTLRRLDERGSTASVILMSGYARGAIGLEVDAERKIAFLQKPFRLSELRATITAVLFADESARDESDRREPA